MSFVRPDIYTLIARIRADQDGRLKGADSKLPKSLLDVLARVEAGAFDDAYAYAASIALDIMPDTADSDHLLRWAAIWGVPPKSAKTATGTVVASGLDGKIVPAGSIVQRADGVSYVLPVATPIVAGAAAIAGSAVEVGADGNAAAGTTLTFVSPTFGVDAEAVVGTGGFTGGRDDESPDSLLARLLARIQSPPNGGARSDYEAWALAQPEVTRAWVYPGWMGAGTVGVAVVMDAREIIFPTADDCAAIAAAIEPDRPVTASLTVFSPIPLVQNFNLRLIPSTAATKAAAAAELADLFLREAQPGGTIPISHIREAIAVAAGVSDYTLNIPAGPIVAPRGYMPSLGAITWA